MKFTLLSFALLVSMAEGQVLSLTEANFNEMTAGKTVFIKFFAPWCGHCKAMAADWETLASEWANHDIGLIAEVDCTQEAGLCEDFEVTGYPTLYYGDPSTPVQYDGGRDLESLSAFAKENLGKLYCSIDNPVSCSDEEKKIIADLETKTVEELANMLADIEEKAEAMEEAFQIAVEDMQNGYDKLVEDYNAKVDTLKSESHYSFARSILVKKEGGADTAGDEL